MRCRRSKTPATRIERIRQKIWLCPVGNTWHPSQWLRQNTNSTTSVQSSEPEVNWFFGRTPEIGKRCVRSRCPSNHWPIHICQKPPQLKKSINQAHLENGTYEKIVTHLERELGLNSLEYLDETQMNTLTHKQQIEGNPDNAGNINSDTNDSNPNNHKIDRKSRTLYSPCETSGKLNHATERCYVGANAASRPLHWKSKPQQQDAQDSITGCVQATA